MDTVSETVNKVDEGLQEMGISSVKNSLKDFLNFKQYIENQIPAVIGFWKKNHSVDSEGDAAFPGKSQC